MLCASTGPITRTMRTTLFTEPAVTLPLTSDTCTSPSTEFTCSGPWHERTVTSPRIDCARSDERMPVTEMSPSMPDRSSGSHTGTVSRHSTSAGEGSRELTPSLSVPFASSVTKRSVRSCSACTRTSLRSQAVTSMSPARFASMSVTPGPTRSTVSVVMGRRMARAFTAFAHSIDSMGTSGPSTNTRVWPATETPGGSWPLSIACCRRTMSACVLMRSASVRASSAARTARASRSAWAAGTAAASNTSAVSARHTMEKRIGARMMITPPPWPRHGARGRACAAPNRPGSPAGRRSRDRPRARPSRLRSPCG